MPFDFDSALKAGNSKASINQYLADKHGFDYGGAASSGYNDDAIFDHLSSKELGGQPYTPPPPEKGKVASTLSDLGTAFKQGVESLPGMVTGLVDIPAALITGQRPISAAADYIGEKTGFQPGKWAKEAETQYSPGHQQAEQDITDAWQKVGDAWTGESDQGVISSLGGVAREYLNNPAYSAGQIVESIPSMVAGGAIGRGLMTAGRVAVPAVEGVAAKVLPGYLERLVGKETAAAITGGIGEGTVQAGQQMDQYQGTDQRKNAIAAISSGIVDAVISGFGGVAAQKLGLETPETLMAKGFNDGIKKELSLGRRLAGGAVAEGLLQEFPQSAQEQIWSNYAENKPLMEGVPRAAVEGAIAGSVMGAGANIQGPFKSTVTPETELATPQQSQKELVAEMEMKINNLKTVAVTSDVAKKNLEELQAKLEEEKNKPVEATTPTEVTAAEQPVGQQLITPTPTATATTIPIAADEPVQPIKPDYKNELTAMPMSDFANVMSQVTAKAQPPAAKKEPVQAQPVVAATSGMPMSDFANVMSQATASAKSPYVSKAYDVQAERIASKISTDETIERVPSKEALVSYPVAKDGDTAPAKRMNDLATMPISDYSKIISQVKAKSSTPVPTIAAAEQQPTIQAPPTAAERTNEIEAPKLAAMIQSEIRQGQGGSRAVIEGLTEDKTISVPTTNAPYIQIAKVKDYYKKQGLTGEALKAASGKINRVTVEATLNKVIGGKGLSPVQQKVWSYLQDTRGKEQVEQNKDINDSLKKIETAGIDIGQPKQVQANSISKGDQIVLTKNGQPDLFTAKGLNEDGQLEFQDDILLAVNPDEKLEVMGSKPGELSKIENEHRGLITQIKSESNPEKKLVLREKANGLTRRMKELEEGLSQTIQAPPTAAEQAPSIPVQPIAAKQQPIVIKKASIKHFNDTMDSLGKGELSIEDYKSAFELISNDPDSLKSELMVMTKDQIFKQMGNNFAYRNKSEKKEDLVKSAIGQLVSNFTLGKSISYSMSNDMEKSHDDAVRKIVYSMTDKELNDYSQSIKSYEDEKKSVLAGAHNPKTLDDFRMAMRLAVAEGKTRREALLSFRPEQRIEYDRLEAETSRSQRTTSQGEQNRVVLATPQTMAGKIVETKHTKTGDKLFMVQPEARVERDVYTLWNNTAKKMGGHYSSFGKVKGFQFKDTTSAEAFLKFLGGDTSEAKATVSSRLDVYADNKTQSAVERLNEMADNIENKGNESLSQSRKVNTARRAGIAARAESNANDDVAIAKTMRNIANAISEGKVKFLDKVRQKVQIELLQSKLRSAQWEELRSKYKDYVEQERHKYDPPTAETADYIEFPYYTSWRSQLAEMGREMIGIDGTKKLGKRLLKVADDVTKEYINFAKENFHLVSTFTNKSGELSEFSTNDAAKEAISRSGFKGKATTISFKRGEHLVIMGPEMAKEKGVWKGTEDKRITLKPDFVEEVMAKAKSLGKNKITVPYYFELIATDRARLKGMGIETPAELRSAIREFIGLKTAPKEIDKVKQLERDMVGRKNDSLDFFPTPASTVQEMINTADIKDGMSALEPSAGMGHIAEVIRASGVEPDVVEISSSRRELLEAKGFNVIGRDFMDIEGNYDRIIMNPPFSNRRDVDHVQHAYTLLNPNGRVVAIMGEGVFFGQDKKAAAFRNWLESVGGTSEKLEQGTFLDPTLPVNTGVSARMVVIDKSVSGTDKLPSSGEIKLSQSNQPVSTTTTVEQATKEITTSEHGKAIQQLIDNGKLKVVSSIEELPAQSIPSGTNGAYLKSTDTMYLVASGIGNGNVTNVVLHEFFHRANVNGEFESIMKELGVMDRMYQAGTPMAEWFNKARESAQVDKDSPHYLEEIAAYAVQQYKESPNVIKAFVDKLIAKVKAILIKTFGVQIGKISPAMLHEIAIGGLKVNSGVKGEAKGDTFPIDQTTPGSYPLFSQSTTTEAAQAAQDLPTNEALSRSIGDRVGDYISDLADNNPKWQDRWERLVYNLVDINDPRRLVYKSAGTQASAKTDIVTVERLRGKKAAEAVRKFMEEKVTPILKGLAEAKLSPKDIEEYKHALHVPERNERMQQINAKRYLDMLLGQMTEEEAAYWKLEMQHARDETVMNDALDSKDTQKKYLKIMQEIFDSTNDRQTELEDKRTDLENREFTAEEVAKGTPERKQKNIDNAQKRLDQTAKIQAEWEKESPRWAGITDDDAITILEKWDKDPRIKKINDLSARIDEINQGRLDVLHESGQLSDEEYYGISAMYEHYVPLQRAGFEDEGTTRTGKITGPTGNPLEVAKGSMREVVDILANTVENYQAAVIRAHKVEGARALYEFALANPDAGITVDEQEQKPTYDREGNIKMYTDQQEPKDGVFIKLEGKRYLLSFDTDTRTAKGRRLARFLDSIKDSGATSGSVINLLSKVNRTLSLVNTSLSPEFIITNFCRDFQTAFIHLNEENISQDKLKRNIAKDIFPAIKGIFTSERHGKDSEMGKWYKDFAANGGKIGWMQGYEHTSDLATAMANEMKLYGEGHITRKTIHSIGAFISQGNTAVENGVRLATYKNLVESGVSKSKAAVISSGLTVDFTQHGKMGPTINAFYMFANAGIQGNVRMIKAISTSPKVQKIVGSIVVAGFLMQMAALSGGGDDDTGDPNILNVPDYVRERNMVIMRFNGKFVKIPMPYGYNCFHNIGSEIANNIYMAATGRKYDSLSGAMRVATSFANSFNPIGAGTILQTLSPTITDPIVMAAENRDFTGRNLMPEQSPYGVPKPDSERYWKSASPISKAIASTLNSLTKGDRYEGGFIDISPETLEMMFSTVTGSMGRFVGNVVSLPPRILSGEIEERNIPFVRTIFGGADNRAISERYHKSIEDVALAELRVKGTKDLAEKNKFKQTDEYKNRLLAKSAKRRIKNLSKMLRLFEAKGSDLKAKEIKDKILKIKTEYLKKSL